VKIINLILFHRTLFFLCW